MTCVFVNVLAQQNKALELFTLHAAQALCFYLSLSLSLPLSTYIDK